MGDNAASPLKESKGQTKVDMWGALDAGQNKKSDGEHETSINIAQKTVYIKVVFLKITDIDTPKEQFLADVYIQARWEASDVDINKEYDEKDLFAMWNPKLQVQNVISDTRDSKWIEVNQLPSGETFISEKRRIKGTFAESMELEHFPFDIQDISIIITSELSEAELTIVEDKDHLSRIFIENFSDEQEWALFDYVECVQRLTTKAFMSSSHKYPGLIARTAARRRGAFFIFNIVCIMVLISSLVLATFAVSRDKVQNRLQLTFILVLTGIAFKFVSTQSLPKISYLTYLDKYIIGSMLVMYLVAIWHAIVSRFGHDLELQADMDNYAFFVVLVCYLIFQIGFGIIVFFGARIRQKIARNKEIAFQERAKLMLGTKFEERKFRKSMRQKKQMDTDIHDQP